ncbi:MAG: bifunctional folylpolyglutamate synthase/dihydrofolate synthase [Planctomycetota bacterium]|jgi:dihydrofolate synthase/folylpolyglutamate synthase
MNSNPLPDRIRDRDDLDALLVRATNYEERPLPAPTPRVFKLDRVRALLASVEDPHLGPVTVHVAGSKGKGSVARMVARGLLVAGRGPVGLFTSPHLTTLAERIRVDGVPATDAELAAAADALLPHVRRHHETPRATTFFELLTGMAVLVFRARGCRSVVLETGLGGRLDATNLCRPSVTVITTIEREHTAILGDTLEEIAAEKAGILKTGVPAVTGATGPALSVIEARAADVGAPLAVLGRELELLEANTGEGPVTRVRIRTPGTPGEAALYLPLAGAHHGANAAMAWWTLERLGIPADDARRGLEGVRLPGVLEPVGGDPLVILDGAHTPGSAAAARDALAACWPGRRSVLLLALLQGKEAEGVAAALAPAFAHAIVTTVPTPRSMDGERLAEVVRGQGLSTVEVVADPVAALARARHRAGAGGLVLATGTVRLAGLLRPSLVEALEDA